MDRELLMAYHAGIDYFVYDFYPDATTWPCYGNRALWAGIHNAIQYHMASPYASLVKFALALILSDANITYAGGVTSGAQNSTTLTNANWTTLCNLLVGPTFFANPLYQTASVPGVGTNSPILYLFDNNAFNAMGGNVTVMQMLLSIASTAGFSIANSNKPYIGYLGTSPTDAPNGASNTGSQFISNYAAALPNTASTITQAQYDTVHSTTWTNYVTNGNGNGIVPFLGVGWNAASRNSTVNSFWSLQIPPYGIGPSQNTITATPAELANRARNMLSYFSQHTDLWNNNHVLLCSWDEFSEDGNAMCPHNNPTGDAYGGNLHAVAQALGKQRFRSQSLKSRGISVTSR